LRFHPSDLQSYARCAYAYGLGRNGVPGRTNSGAAYGSVLHHALQVLERLRAEGVPFEEALARALASFIHYWHPANIEAICDPVPADGWLPKRSYGECRARGIEAIKQYAELIRDDDHEMLALEFGFAVPIDGTWDEDLGEPHIIAGTVDRLLVRFHRRLAAVCIDDWKSAMRRPEYLRHNIQFTSYCATPETPILMGDYSWKPFGELAVGDTIMGVDEEPVETDGGVRRRHWRRTTVNAIWRTRKPAFRVACNDGTEFTVGAGHRLLAQREGGWAWRTVEDLVENLDNPRRKTAGIKVFKVMPEPREIDYCSADYMAGYIAGATLGDGSISRPTGHTPFWTIGVGVADADILDRLRAFLREFGVQVFDWTREPDGRGWQRNPMAGLRTHSVTAVDQIRSMCERAAESDDYVAGWLAGMYDTDGGRGTNSNVISFYQKDFAVLESIAKHLNQLGFEGRVGAKSVELIGDKSTRVAFTATIRPALARKVEDLDNTTVRVISEVRIVAIESVGEQDLVDMTTGTSTYVGAGVVQHNCYASTKKEFWTGWRGEDGFGEDRGTDLYERFHGAGRRATWIDMHKMKFVDAGWRGPIDYRRLTLAVEQMAAAVKNEIYPLSISGENCHFCSYRAVCGGGLPDALHGDPLKTA
jgi:hypothetical protein